MISNFSVNRRNHGHWDIWNDKRRIFSIRGGPSNYFIRDEREDKPQRELQGFKTVNACMACICDELMYELIVADGQEPAIIESWNV